MVVFDRVGPTTLISILVDNLSLSLSLSWFEIVFIQPYVQMDKKILYGSNSTLST